MNQESSTTAVAPCRVRSRNVEREVLVRSVRPADIVSVTFDFAVLAFRPADDLNVHSSPRQFNALTNRVRAEMNFFANAA